MYSRLHTHTHLNKPDRSKDWEYTLPPTHTPPHTHTPPPTHKPDRSKDWEYTLPPTHPPQTPLHTNLIEVRTGSRLSRSVVILNVDQLEVVVETSVSEFVGLVLVDVLQIV